MVTTRSGVDSRAGGSAIRSRSAGKRAILGTVKISPKPKSSGSSTSQSSKSQTPETNMGDMIQDTFTDRISSLTQVSETPPAASFTSSSTAVSAPKSNISLDDYMTGDETVDRSPKIMETEPTLLEDAITASVTGDTPDKQNLKGKGKSSEYRKTVAFQEPPREVVRAESLVPIGDAHANIRFLYTAETLGKKLYLEYIRKR